MTGTTITTKQGTVIHLSVQMELAAIARKADERRLRKILKDRAARDAKVQR